MKIELNQYIADISPKDVLERNVISCTNFDNNKTILIRSSDNSKETLTFENEYFLMKNNIVLSVAGEEIGNFHIMVCKKNDINSINHFFRVCDYLFIRPNIALSAEEMLKLFGSLETIFKTHSERNLELEIGLYGELSLLNYLYEQNNDIYKLWHAEFFSKHDLELNNKTKIEVKTTVKDTRKHRFSHDQIVRLHLHVFVVSIMLKTVENGLSLYDLCVNTMNMLDNNQLLSLEILMKKLGLSEEYGGINCIKEETYESIKLFDANKIPHIEEEIPEGVSCIKYDIDLSNIESVPFSKLVGDE